MITTQEELDAVPAGTRADIGRSVGWLDAREGSTVDARQGSTVTGQGKIIHTDRSATQAAFNKAVAKAILADPSRFDMSQWSCGSSMCWAEWAVHLADDGEALKDDLTYSGAGAYLCGHTMMHHFWRTDETAGMLKFAEVIAAGGTIADADKASRS